jgi:hypothetical protein
VDDEKDKRAFMLARIAANTTIDALNDRRL